MKRNIFGIGSGLIIITIVVATVTMGFLAKSEKKMVKPAVKGFAVIELFTSEGCSSCPSADSEVEKISVSQPDGVYVLSFHVDYWNRLGWKDEFSDAAYSARQRVYADHFNLNSVYTPQVVLNGKQQFVGSDAAKLKRSVDTGIKTTANQFIELTAIGSDSKTVQVAYKLQSVPDNMEVNIALIQMAAQIKVKRGENEGRTLRHINIVRDFKTFSLQSKGTASLTIPNGIISKDCKVIVYLQLQHTREITAVAAAFIK